MDSWQAGPEMHKALEAVRFFVAGNLGKEVPEKAQYEALQAAIHIWNMMHIADLCSCDKPVDDVLLSLLLLVAGIYSELGISASRSRALPVN